MELRRLVFVAADRSPLRPRNLVLVRVAVAVKNSTDLPKLVEGLKKLSKSDPMVRVETTDAGEHIIAGCGELHLEICLKDLQEDFMKGAPLNITPPVVTYNECITVNSTKECLSKSANKHNRIFARAVPLSAEVEELLESGTLSEQTEEKNINREGPPVEGNRG